MDSSGFSKVSAVLEDEEDERRRFISRAHAQFNAAQDAYTSKGSHQDVLRLFEGVEASLAPLLGNGLMCLAPRELEMVLKSRLHQGVIIAQLSDYPDRWGRVKALAEQVMQYDFSNCHARWLRGLALLHGLQRRDEAKEEMQRAVDCARTSGKTGEAQTWEAEIKSQFGAVASIGTDSSVVETSVEGAVPERITEIQDDDVPVLPTIQKGFFNRRSPKVVMPSKGATTMQPEAMASVDPQPHMSQVEEQSRQQQEQSNVQEEAYKKQLQQQQEQSNVQEEAYKKQLEELHHELQKQTQIQLEQKEQLLQWQQGLQDALATVKSDFERALVDECRRPKEDSSIIFDRLQTAVAGVMDQLQADKIWAESEHQKYMDFSTDVVTLHEMLARELREREDSSRQRITEMRDLARRIGELKTTVKTLREHARMRSNIDAQEENSEPDLQRYCEHAAEFHALPASTKLWAFVDDAGVLRLMALATFLGMLFAMGFFIEAFNAMGCRFVCAR